jgi:hypothetical protein
VKDDTCSIEGCERRATTRSWCGTHYQRWRKYGTTDTPPRFQPKECSVEDCERVVRRNGLCEMHDRRKKANGDPLIVQRIMRDDEARFLQYVDKDGPTPIYRPELGPCWIWTGVKHKRHGYGRFYVGGRGGRYIQAHRWSYEASVAPIPAGLTIDHLCRVTRCVNPTHLEPVTGAENNRRAAEARRAR